VSAAGHPILEAWIVTRERLGSTPAIRDASNAVCRTYDDIEAEALRFQERFASIAANSAVAVQLGNEPAWPAVLLALWRSRLVPLPLGAHVEEVELRGILETCGVATLLSSSGGDIQIRSTGVAPQQSWPTPAPEFLKLTSGTTAAPRGIRFRAAQLLADCDQICETMGISDSDLNFGVLPFSHSYGFSNLLLPLICRGVPLVATSDRLPRAMLDGLERTSATVFPGMPVFFEKLAGIDSPASLPVLRLCISAGAPLTAKVAEDFTRAFSVRVHSFYGSSECGGIAYDRSEAAGYEDGCVGEPMCGVRIERDAPGPRRITVHSAAVGDGYYPVEDPETLSGGRFVPGDFVEWRERGMVITGRSTDVINIAGRKLNPGEVEGRIARFPGVRQVVVFGVPSALRGEEPIACIQGDQLEVAALQRYCRAELSAWQTPRDFWLVDEIPTNERGKTSRRALAEEYQKRGKSSAGAAVVESSGT